MPSGWGRCARDRGVGASQGTDSASRRARSRSAASSGGAAPAGPAPPHPSPTATTARRTAADARGDRAADTVLWLARRIGEVSVRGVNGAGPVRVPHSLRR